ncbi:MAG: c-type cytochrome [Rhodocyclaceae bacterium]|nr:c-type cytochrome [Rhodocyclaceae bacterium]
MFRTNSRSLAIAGVLALSATVALAMGSRPKADDESANARIAPLARVELAGAQQAAAPGGRSGEEIYKAVCGACHEAGVAGAPKTGDKAAWAARIALGLNGLVKSATAGKNAMPPNGGSDASPEELARVIAFMANKSGASFKAPK